MHANMDSSCSCSCTVDLLLVVFISCHLCFGSLWSLMSHDLSCCLFAVLLCVFVSRFGLTLAWVGVITAAHGARC